jgi:hypothetical protein
MTGSITKRKTPSDWDQRGPETPFVRSPCQTFEISPPISADLSTSTIGSGHMGSEPAVAACRSKSGWRILTLISTKSRESIYGSSVRHSAERAAEARKEADRLACVAWNQRMLGFKGPAQPSPSLGDALNARYLYLEVRCLGCDTHQIVALNISGSEHCPPAEGDAHPRTGAVHALQGLLAGSRLSVQAEPSCGAPTHKEFST